MIFNRDKIIRKYLIRKINRLRPTRWQLYDDPRYYKGCSDTITKILDIIEKSKN